MSAPVGEALKIARTVAKVAAPEVALPVIALEKLPFEWKKASARVRTLRGGARVIEVRKAEGLTFHEAAVGLLVLGAGYVAYRYGPTVVSDAKSAASTIEAPFKVAKTAGNTLGQIGAAINPANWKLP